MLLRPQAGCPAEIETLAGQLLERAAEPIRIAGISQPLPVTVSIGIAFHPDHDPASHDPLDNAELALERAKIEGRNTYRLYTPALAATAHLRRILRRDLGPAIGSPAMTMAYQPLVDVSSREPIGFEALIRWTHPELGPISPALFIPIAEEEGLIGRLGEWILRHVVQEAARWQRPLNIAVNLSPIQIYEGDLPALVARILADSGLAPQRLELEITEGVLLDDRERALDVLGRLKALGVRIAMDDFGTGYSSLHYLQSFPFDKIKIDRSFITDMNINRHAQAIVRAVIGLCQSIAVPVVAEGVETDEQLHLLATLACDQVQGYLTGRPRAAGQLPPLVNLPVESRAL